MGWAGMVELEEVKVELHSEAVTDRGGFESGEKVENELS